MITDDERQKHETRITRAVLRARQSQLEKLLAYLGNPPDARKYKTVPDELWKEIEKDEKAILIPLFAAVALVSADRVSRKIGFETETDKLAQLYAERQAAVVARDAVKNSRALLRDLSRRVLRDELVGKELQADMDVGLDEIFGRSRAENAGITETTAADSGGGRGVVDVARGDGRKVALYWVTARDSKTCPICRPLHGTPEEVWSRQFPNGPGAHPRCRCELRYSSGMKQGQPPENPPQ